MSDGCPWPRISIVTPSYNQGHFIEETIRSVLLQGYPNLEYFVIDGGSTDESVEILRKYEPWLTHWESERDRGQGHAINKGWKRATGQILAWLNSDDVYRPGALHQVRNAFRDHHKVSVVVGVCSGTDKFRNEVSRKSPTFDPKDLLFGGRGPGQPAVFLCRKVFDTIGGLNEELHYVLDKDYWFRIISHYPMTSVIPLSSTLADSRNWEKVKSVTGGVRIWVEYREMINRFYAASPLSSDYAHLRRAAYSQVCWNIASCEMAVGRKYEAFKHLMRALILDVRLYRPMQITRLFAGILLPSNWKQALKFALSGQWLRTRDLP